MLSFLGSPFSDVAAGRLQVALPPSSKSEFTTGFPASKYIHVQTGLYIICLKLFTGRSRSDVRFGFSVSFESFVRFCACVLPVCPGLSETFGKRCSDRRGFVPAGAHILCIGAI